MVELNNLNIINNYYCKQKMSLDSLFKSKTKLNKMNIKNSYIIPITFQEIFNILNNNKIYKLLKPPFQTALDENRIEQMIESYNLYPEHLLSKSIITIAIIEIGNEKEYYLMDGQHRMEMIKRIYEETKDNNCVLFAIQYIESEEKMRKLFEELNKDSIKNKPYVSLPIFDKFVIENVKKLLYEKYEGAFERTKNDKRSLYSVEEFINFLVENDYFKNNKKNPTEIITEIDNKHKQFFAKLKYLENGQSERHYTKCEIDAINTHKITIFFKNNNFIEYLLNNDLPYHDTNTDRKNINQTLKEKVWEEEFGNKTNYKCPIIYCKNYINKNTKFGFQCVCIDNDENIESSNLKPACMECYYDIKNKKLDLDDYEKLIIWEDEFGSDSEGECDDCNKKINFKNSFLKITKSNKNKKNINKLVCKKCN